MKNKKYNAPHRVKKKMNKINIDNINISKIRLPNFPNSNVINKYNIVHTGPKTQSGGLKLGFVNNEYQGSL